MTSERDIAGRFTPLCQRNSCLILCDFNHNGFRFGGLPHSLPRSEGRRSTPCDAPHVKRANPVTGRVSTWAAGHETHAGHRMYVTESEPVTIYITKYHLCALLVFQNDIYHILAQPQSKPVA